MENRRDEWPIFLAYRQRDGKEAAEWLYHNLNGAPARPRQSEDAEAPTLSLYYDQTSAAVSNWKKLHGDALMRARALLLICSPGAAASVDKEDQLFREIRWWIETRDAAPIFVDSTGDDDRWIPALAKERWPDAQRIQIIPDELSRMPKAEREQAEARIRDRIIAGIITSQSRVLDEDLERQKGRTRRLKAQLIGIGVLLVATLAAVAIAVRLWKSSQGLLEASQVANERAEVELYYSGILLSRQYIENGQYELAQETLFGCAEELRNWEWGHLLALSYLEMPTARIEVNRYGQAALGKDDVPGELRWGEAGSLPALYGSLPTGRSLEVESPDGRFVLRTPGDYEETEASVFDVASGEVVSVLRGHARYVSGAAFTPDGSRVVTTSSDSSARVWDPTSGRQLLLLTTEAEWRSHSGRRDSLSQYTGGSDFPGQLGFSPDGRNLAGLGREVDCLWPTYPFREEQLPGDESRGWSERFQLWRTESRRGYWERRLPVPSTLPDEGREHVFVSTPLELLMAIGSDRVIELAPGTYDMTQLDGRTTRSVRWEPNFDGSTMTVFDVKNLTLVGRGEEPVSLFVRPRYVYVLAFERCREVELRNLRLGHEPDKGSCDSGVVGVVDTQGFSMQSCDLYGSGTEGIVFKNVVDALIEDVIIRDCSYGILTLELCNNIEFRRTSFFGNEEFWGLQIRQSRDIAFRDVTMADNRSIDPFVGVDGSYGLSFFGGEIRENNAPALTDAGSELTFERVSFSFNSFDQSK